MSWYDTLLFLHVLGAFGMVAGMVFFWGLIAATWNVDRPSTALTFFRLTRPADLVVNVGFVVALVFGIWLAIYLDGYELWDGWILGTLILWAIAAETGRRTGKAYAVVRDRARELAAEGDAPSPELRAMFQTRTGLLFQTVTTIALIAALALMIWKPGGV